MRSRNRSRPAMRPPSASATRQRSRPGATRPRRRSPTWCFSSAPTSPPIRPADNSSSTAGAPQRVARSPIRWSGEPMALLIIELDKRIGNAQAWRDTFREQIPELPIRIWPDAGEAKDIEYLAFMHPDFNALPAFPNLKAMFSRAAGVDDIVKHPKLPKVPLGKVEPPGGDPMMTEYVVMHVLRLHREMPAYQAAQARRESLRIPPAPAQPPRRAFFCLR